MRANKKIPRKNLKEIKICINQIKRIKSGVGQEKGGKKTHCRMQGNQLIILKTIFRN
jgi:hypothetical protein